MFIKYVKKNYFVDNIFYSAMYVLVCDLKFMLNVSLHPSGGVGFKRVWLVIGSNPIKGSSCFLETLPSLISTGWLQGRVEPNFMIKI